MANAHINIMLRQVGRIWECKVTCSLHDCTGLAADLDDKEKVLTQGLEKLPCICWSNSRDKYVPANTPKKPTVIHKVK